MGRRTRVCWVSSTVVILALAPRSLYHSAPQNLNLTLLCDKSAKSTEPQFVSYTAGCLSLEWASPDACPRDGDYEKPPGTGGGGEDGDEEGGGGSSSGGWGFWGLMKFLFWMAIVGLMGYFAIGKSALMRYYRYSKCRRK